MEKNPMSHIYTCDITPQEMGDFLRSITVYLDQNTANIVRQCASFLDGVVFSQKRK